jgi:hypothetical protein
LATYGQNSQIDFSDSASVRKFTLTHSACEQIDIGIKYKLIIVEENSYGSLLLQSISKISKTNFYIPIAGHYTGIYSKDQQVTALEEQLFDVRKNLKCQNK